uniref:16 kDa beta-galactoside-binding lectin-like n=1 Tax=Euleptes europaea TaxID=460621 RepID=UPI0025420CDA|nr:16 kDa beta-galactoside-binding lectin-like [Euleptes europaea]
MHNPEVCPKSIPPKTAQGFRVEPICQAFAMESQLVVINLHARKCIEVNGKVPPEAKSFALNVGSDASNILLHFNPRFDSGKGIGTIVCNSLKNQEWGEAQKNSLFPFQQGKEAKLSISFDAKNLTVKVSEKEAIKFPNRFGLERIEFLSVDGDFKVQLIKID